MREILFRGKRLDDGEWVEGSLLIDGIKHRPIRREALPLSNSYIVPETPWDNIKTFLTDGSILLNINAYHVIPETIGQYTGLCDKNGKKIFEGDIVTFKTRTSSFKPCYVSWYKEQVQFLVTTPDGCCSYPMDRAYEYEVIGNVYDNRDLLEV